MKNSAYDQAFQEAYQQLNAQQREAVDRLEGPVMVIAGPGTGKTQILSARIGKILQDTDARPENILCLTYTDAGAVAMRKRLLGFIGPDAYKVNIYTFHAFCNDIIQDNLYLFEKNTLEAISELESIELFKELIDSFPKNHLLKRYRGDVYYEAGNLQYLFSSMKREGWSPAYINEKIDEYIATLPYKEELFYKNSRAGKWNKGDPKPAYQEILDKMEKLRAAVNEFERFQELMRKHNRYDFDDMINWVIRAFEENSGLLAAYQEKFQYILVDEYQDTSGSQNRLVQLLLNYWGEAPNVFVVGDDDQSIYRFQGANIDNLVNFADSYRQALQTIVLTSNYRSTQPILDASKRLIDRNNERLVKKLDGLSKELVAANERIRHLQHPPVIRQYPTQKEEMIDLTLRVEALLAQGVPPGHIAIIYKENKYGTELARYFALRKIPFYSKRSLNLLEIPLAKQIIRVFQYIAAEHDAPFGGDELLFEILHYNWFGIPPIEIARLSVEASGKLNDYGEGSRTSSLRESLQRKISAPPATLFSPELPKELKTAGKVLEELIGDASNSTLQQLFENIVRKAGVLTSIMNSPDKIWLLKVITALFDFIKEETRRKPDTTLEELVTSLDLMKKEGVVLPLVQISGSENGVNLLTAHGSKGLEFEYVFLAGANAGFWEKKRKPGGGYRLPDTLFTSVTAESEKEELRRLFYVALTRAEQHLAISYCQFKDDGKEQEPSVFLAEIREGASLPVEEVTPGEAVVAEFSALELEGNQAPEIEKIETEFVNRALEKFVMNVTALNNYLKCPLEFYYRNLIAIPSPKNEAAEFGSAIHFALEKLFRKMLGHPQRQFPSRAEFIEDFEWWLHHHREGFTREQFARRLEQGQIALGDYYDQYINSFSKDVEIERSLRNMVNGVPIKGRLDKLELNGKQVNVVDYKTGDPDKADPRLKPPSDKDPLGGSYWRQAVFYKLLADNYDHSGRQVVSSEFDFIEPDKKKSFRKAKVIIEPEHIKIVIGQITDTWEKIRRHEFYTGCGKPDCHWCNFVKENKLAVALHEIEEEE